MPRAAFRSPFASPARSPPRAFLLRTPAPSPSPPPRRRHTLLTTVVDESVATAAELVERWHPDRASEGSFLFVNSNRGEARDFLRSTADLHRAMLFFASDDGARSGDRGQGLVEAQALLETAMRRLELELHVLLSSLPNADDDNNSHDADAVRAIQAVAVAMVAAGYGKECFNAFKSRRRAAVERLLGFPSSQHAQFHKLNWDQVDAKIRSWLAAAPVAFKSVFAAERALCDNVFTSDKGISDAVFAAIAHEQATNMLAVPEAAAARARRTPERLFRVLDMHDTIVELLPAMASVFGDESKVMARAATALTKISESVRGAVAGLEAAIQKEPSKAIAPGGAVHPLTRYVMNYLVFLADYEDAVADIYAGAQFLDTSVVSRNASPESSLSSPSSNPIAWLVLVLLCKLDEKAGSYREAALSYLFLANNVHYIAKKVTGSKLERILGEEWTAAHEAKVRRYVDAYVRAAWGGAVTAITTARGAEGVEDKVVEAVLMQEERVAEDEEIAEAVRAAATAAVVPSYRAFYRRYGFPVRLTPGDVNQMIAGLFGGGSARMGFGVQARCTVSDSAVLRREDQRSSRLSA